MRVSLFVSCLVDQVRPEAGISAVKVLKQAGCEVSFPQGQTCCGQPAFNSGHLPEACRVASSFLEVFADAEVIVVPSGSCAAMISHMPSLFAEGSREKEVAESIARKTHEFSSFLVNNLGVQNLGARFSGRVAWHDACHALRDLHIKSGPRRLLAEVEGLELVNWSASDACCGFGGTFAVKHPDISVAILDSKLKELETLGVDAVASGDAGCLMQIEGRLDRQSSRIQGLHLAEILASR